MATPGLLPKKEFHAFVDVLALMYEGNDEGCRVAKPTSFKLTAVAKAFGSHYGDVYDGTARARITVGSSKSVFYAAENPAGWKTLTPKGFLCLQTALKKKQSCRNAGLSNQKSPKQPAAAAAPVLPPGEREERKVGVGNPKYGKRSDSPQRQETTGPRSAGNVSSKAERAKSKEVKVLVEDDEALGPPPHSEEPSLSCSGVVPVAHALSAAPPAAAFMQPAYEQASFYEDDSVRVEGHTILLWDLDTLFPRLVERSIGGHTAGSTAQVSTGTGSPNGVPRPGPAPPVSIRRNKLPNQSVRDSMFASSTRGGSSGEPLSSPRGGTATQTNKPVGGNTAAVFRRRDTAYVANRLLEHVQRRQWVPFGQTPFEFHPTAIYSTQNKACLEDGNDALIRQLMSRKIRCVKVHPAASISEGSDNTVKANAEKVRPIALAATPTFAVHCNAAPFHPTSHRSLCLDYSLRPSNNSRDGSTGTGRSHHQNRTSLWSGSPSGTETVDCMLDIVRHWIARCQEQQCPLVCIIVSSDPLGASLARARKDKTGSGSSDENKYIRLIRYAAKHSVKLCFIHGLTTEDGTLNDDFWTAALGGDSDDSEKKEVCMTALNALGQWGESRMSSVLKHVNGLTSTNCEFTAPRSFPRRMNFDARRRRAKRKGAETVDLLTVKKESKKDPKKQEALNSTGKPERSQSSKKKKPHEGKPSTTEPAPLPPAEKPGWVTGRSFLEVLSGPGSKRDPTGPLPTDGGDERQHQQRLEERHSGRESHQRSAGSRAPDGTEEEQLRSPTADREQKMEKKAQPFPFLITDKIRESYWLQRGLDFVRFLLWHRFGGEPVEKGKLTNALLDRAQYGKLAISILVPHPNSRKDHQCSHEGGEFDNSATTTLYHLIQERKYRDTLYQLALEGGNIGEHKFLPFATIRKPHPDRTEIVLTRSRSPNFDDEFWVQSFVQSTNCSGVDDDSGHLSLSNDNDMPVIAFLTALQQAQEAVRGRRPVAGSDPRSNVPLVVFHPRYILYYTVRAMLLGDYFRGWHEIPSIALLHERLHVCSLWVWRANLMLARTGNQDPSRLEVRFFLPPAGDQRTGIRGPMTLCDFLDRSNKATKPLVEFLLVELFVVQCDERSLWNIYTPSILHCILHDELHLNGYVLHDCNRHRNVPLLNEGPCAELEEEKRYLEPYVPRCVERTPLPFVIHHKKDSLTPISFFQQMEQSPTKDLILPGEEEQLSSCSHVEMFHFLELVVEQEIESNHFHLVKQYKEQLELEFTAASFLLQYTRDRMLEYRRWLTGIHGSLWNWCKDIDTEWGAFMKSSEMGQWFPLMLVSHRPKQRRASSMRPCWGGSGM